MSYGASNAEFQPEQDPFPEQGGGDGLVETTLDESVLTTIGRDLKSIGYKIYHVMIPRLGAGDYTNALRDWDLWGPLVLCFLLAVTEALVAPAEQASLVFALVFVCVWAGAFIISINAQLLGGTVSFFQSVCVLAYCLTPLVIAAFISAFVGNVLVSMIVVPIAVAWCIFASLGFLREMVPSDRKLLAVYPVFLFYIVIGWIVLIQ